MFKQKIFIASFIVLIIVAVSNYAGIKYGLYWTYRWFDIPVHALGGLWVSLLFLSAYPYLQKVSNKLDSRKVLQSLLIVILAVTISWEIFELAIGSVFPGQGLTYWIDTITDIINAFIGSIVGYAFYIIEKRNN